MSTPSSQDRSAWPGIFNPTPPASGITPPPPPSAAGVSAAAPGAQPAPAAAAPRGTSTRAQAKRRALARNDKVIRDAGRAGVILTPHQLQPHDFRTDLVDPILGFVVYGIPAPQGSKTPIRRGDKIIVQESSAGVDPWRKNVRQVALQAIQDHTKRTGKPWTALNEPVVVTLAVTLPQPATRAGQRWVTTTPDLDKLQRAVGDALAPVPLKPSEGGEYGASRKKEIREQLMRQRRTACVLHDDSLIAAWGNPHKSYPATVTDSLALPGVAIQIYRLADLDAAQETPTITRDGRTVMRADDFAQWARPHTGEQWADAATRLWTQDAAAILSAQGPARVQGRTATDVTLRYALRILATQGPSAWIDVQQITAPRVPPPPALT